MKQKHLLLICTYAFLLIETNLSEEIFEWTTQFDKPEIRFLFHKFRGLIFNSIGKTSKKTKGIFLQEKFPSNLPFPCDKKVGKSRDYPESVHALRPGGKNLSLIA